MIARTHPATHHAGRAVLRFVAVAALCTAASAGCLSRSPIGNNRSDTPGPTYALAPSAGGDHVAARSTRTFRVDSRIMRTVLDRCQYVAHLQGAVDALPPPGALGIDTPATRFEPRLRFDAWVACPGQTQPAHTTETLTSGRRWTADELAQALAERGAVSVELAGQRCTVRPEYTIRSSVIVGYAANSACTAGATERGGGPPSPPSPPIPPATGTTQGVPPMPPKPEPGTAFRTLST